MSLNKENLSDIVVEICKLEFEVQRQFSKIDTKNTRIAVLNSWCKRATEFIIKVNQLLKRLDDVFEKHVVNKRNLRKTFSNMQFYSVNNQESENALCLSNICDTFEAIGICLSLQYSDLDKFWKVNDKKCVRNVQSLLQNHKPSTLYHAYITNIQESMFKLKEITRRINWEADTLNLMLRYETGKLHDIADQHVILHTMKKLIQEGQIVHYNTFLACENADNQTWFLKKKLDYANKKIIHILGNFSEDKKEKLRCLLHLKQAISSHIAEETVLCENYLQYKMEKMDKQNAILSMENKYLMIENFEETVLLKQGIIKKIIQSIGLGKSKLKHQQVDLINETQKKIIMMKNEFEHHLNKFQELKRQELDLFLKMSMKNLQFSKSGDKKVVNLSIHRLNPQFKQPCDVLLKSIFKTYNMPLYCSPDCILENILKSTTKELYPMDIFLLKDLFKDFNDVIKKLMLYQRNSTALSSLDISLEKGKQITKDCSVFENAVYTWWYQPGQELVPWIREDGFNLNYYISRFIENVSKCKNK
ncbi:uncharacterized protein LOC100209056 isoform X2 [Hydra vulgaris]|uniref:Uncharacterized protein LOC100209056 isoform X2 n=1 Tax=Hydra vulgaris TaxID=6087 RepID=A0ABM4B5V3_HYDVU